ncbi:MAG TPA: RcpC/CpaB family pilus assembly protein [Blastococcus sp.]|nr:RcpC/CpaB family pilus assembly protein [Blastococcus sp.]
MRRRLLAALAALVLLVAGTAVLLAYVRGADARALAGSRPVEVLVVDQLIPEGTSGSDLRDLVRTETVPAKAAVEGRVTELSALRGTVAAVDLQPGEQLLAARFERPDDLQTPGTVAVPAGLQELSVLLEPQRAMGGRLAAGDTVGVYLSQVLPDGTGQTSAVLHEVLVTQVQGAPAAPDPAADTETAASSAPATSLMVTLAINAKDAETIVFGAEHGSLWLSLETEGVETGGTRVLDPGTIYVGVPR